MPTSLCFSKPSYKKEVIVTTIAMLISGPASPGACHFSTFGFCRSQPFAPPRKSDEYWMSYRSITIPYTVENSVVKKSKTQMKRPNYKLEETGLACWWYYSCYQAYLSLIFRTYMVGGEYWLLQVVLWSSHAARAISMCAYEYIQRQINKCSFYLKCGKTNKQLFMLWALSKLSFDVSSHPNTNYKDDIIIYILHKVGEEN